MRGQTMKPESRAYLLHLWKLPLLLLLATTSLAFGQSCPSASGGTVNVTHSSNVQNLVHTCPNGTTFIFANGVYRNVTVFPTNETAHPVDDDQFIAATTGGATLYGAVTPSFVYSSGYYTAR